MSYDEFALQEDANCPLHPVTNDLPSPLPQGLTDALEQVENQLSAVINSTNMVLDSLGGMILCCSLLLDVTCSLEWLTVWHIREPH